jgi:hypothetical protein
MRKAGSGTPNPNSGVKNGIFQNLRVAFLIVFETAIFVFLSSFFTSINGNYISFKVPVMYKNRIYLSQKYR